MEYLKRKVDQYLDEWFLNKNRNPLIIKGARQIGKTESVRQFAKRHSLNLIELNFALNPSLIDIFNDGFSVDTIIKNISLRMPTVKFETGKTLIFFDEIQKYPNATSSLKSFSQDKRYDVICSGSLMGISYAEIESISTGFKEDYMMYSLDFEEFLWAKGYKEDQINDLLVSMKNLKPLTKTEYQTYLNCFEEYMVVGGMPSIVKMFIEQNNYSGVLQKQKQIIRDYEEDITKYSYRLDKGRILNVFRKIPAFLGQDNKKFRISKVANGAKSREYAGTTDWLFDAGMVNISYCLENLSLPLKGNYNPDNYRIYFADTGLLVSQLDEESSNDLRMNKNFNTYKGAIYENVVGEMLKKSGYDLYFFRKDDGTQEIEFFIRDKETLIPIDVKASDGAPKSMISMIENKQIPDIKYGIKLANKNIGFNGKYYTFPYFLTFLLRRFLNE